MRKTGAKLLKSCRETNGDDISNMESGISSRLVQERGRGITLELAPYLYSLTGHPEAKVTVGKMSGIPSVDIYLDMLGLQTDDNDKKFEMAGMIREKIFEKSELLTLEEFEDISHKVLDR